MKRTAIVKLAFVAGLCVLLVRAAPGQTTGCNESTPNVSSAFLDVTVLTLTTGYRYDYVIVNPVSDDGCLAGANLKLPTSTLVSNSDVIAVPPLSRYPNSYGLFTPPGTYSAPTFPNFHGGVGGTGGIAWGSMPIYDAPNQQFLDGPMIHPGESLTAFSIVSPFAPGRRQYRLDVDWDPDAPGTPYAVPDQVDLFAFTVGPTAPSELVFYDGGGQKPSDVNPFLTYTNPVEHRTRLRATETHFPLVVKYGGTTSASTFHASLNGADITSAFHPQPGRIEAVSLSLSSGSNTVVLSIDGQTVGGHTATDTDRLVLLVGP